MKLYELMRDIKIEHGNPNCILDVETREIRRKYGSVYKGELMAWGGVNGRADDIPAYAAGEDVKDYWLESNGTHRITI